MLINFKHPKERTTISNTSESIIKYAGEVSSHLPWELGHCPGLAVSYSKINGLHNVILPKYKEEAGFPYFMVSPGVLCSLSKIQTMRCGVHHCAAYMTAVAVL